MLDYEIAHMKGVAWRWRERRLKSGLPKKVFEQKARTILLSYGWTEENVEEMVKIINKD